MVNNAGKVLAALLFLGCSAYAKLMLQATDLNGTLLSRAQAGRPFKIELTITNTNQLAQMPAIKGLDQLQVDAREQRMQFINNSSSVTYGYRVRAAQPGTYTIGPASVGEEESNIISVHVGAASPTTSNTREPQPAFARFTLHKKLVVVGEKLVADLRFYYQSDATHVHAIKPPSFAEFTVKNEKGPLSGMETINGDNYRYLEWQWELYPKQAGTIEFPAYQFDYSVPDSEKENDLFAAFTLFLRQPRLNKRLYSNATRVTVDPVPAGSAETPIVGTFAHFDAHLKQSVAQEGEGLVLTLELEGNTDFDALEFPQLQGIADHFSWYDSKNYCVAAPGQSGNEKKCFEYILQGVKPGTVQIPSQQFSYFDPQSRTYKTLSSQPISVTIKPRAQQNAPIVAAQNPTITENPPIDQAVEVSDDIALHDQTNWYRYKERAVPWWLFISLALIALLYAVRSIVVARVKARVPQGGQGSDKRNAFARAKTALKNAEAKQAANQIYPIFITLFAMCCDVAEGSSNEEAIEQLLRQRGFSPQQLKQWRSFFNRITEVVFSRREEKQEKDYSELFEQAALWISELERIL